MSETVQLERNQLRPSSLDNLFRCNWFKSTPSDATKRGNQVDDLLRMYFSDKNIYPPEEFLVPEELRAGFLYAANKTIEIAGKYRSEIVASKEGCQVKVPGLPNPATCDGIIAPIFTSIDWKSGGKWDYTRQQAAYSFGQMVHNFSLHWTATCIYYDQQETTWHRFSFVEAGGIVAESVYSYENPQPPTPNEFCGWCKNFNICPAQRELAGHALMVPEGAIDFEAVKADPELLGKFLAGCHAIKKYDEEAREAALQFMFQSKRVPFFSYSKGKRSYYVPAETMVYLATNGVEPTEALARLITIVKAAGPCSKDTYNKICEVFGYTPDPDHIKEQMGQPFVRYTGKDQQQLEK